MVDKALFIGINGAKNSMHQLEIITNNLANLNTPGFRQDFEVMKQYQLKGSDQQSRAYSVIDGTYSDFRTGPMLHTERDLDVAISGKGFIAVQSKDGKEAYTRAGDLQIQNGFLTTQTGQFVMGRGGPISIRNVHKISIGNDGTISARIPGEPDLVTLNRIKLVTPNIKDLHKEADGLFYAKDGQPLKHDESVRLLNGALEGSNVNPVETLTSLIEISRRFEMHTDLMKAIQTDGSKANEILSLSK